MFASRFHWRDFFNTQTPQGRTGILGALLLFLLLVSVIRSLAYGNPSLQVAVFLGRLTGLLVGFTLHEWAHAYVAHRLGGYRALSDSSRLSLDPRVHIETVGVLMVLFVGFGWARPVPVNPQAFYPYERQRLMLVALAGPLMNLLIAAVGALIFRLSVAAFGGGGGIQIMGTAIASHAGLGFGYAVLATFVLLNVLLLWFNLFPLSPLDGWKILLGVLPNEQAVQIRRYERESTFLLWFLILITFFGLPSPLFMLLSPLVDITFGLLMGF